MAGAEKEREKEGMCVYNRMYTQIETWLVRRLDAVFGTRWRKAMEGIAGGEEDSQQGRLVHCLLANMVS